MGYSQAETNTLIKNSLVLSKVGQLDSAEATKYLVSAMKGFNITASESISIIDKLAAVDLESATSAGGIAEALSRTAESAQLAGVSLDKVIGYIATVAEVTQRDEATVGESFKTLFARLQKVAAGVDIDDEGESLNEVDTVLRRLGISITDTAGNFRNMGEVLDEIGSKWNEYTNVEQAQIATAIAGTRQRENLLVLFQNYNQATDYMKTSLNSSGTAMEKFQAYEESLEAKTQRLRASFEGLVNNFTLFGAKGDEAYGNVIDLATGFVKFADSLRLVNIALSTLTIAGLPKLLGTLGQAAPLLTLEKSGLSGLFSFGAIKDNYTKNLQQMSGITLEYVKDAKKPWQILKDGEPVLKRGTKQLAVYSDTVGHFKDAQKQMGYAIKDSTSRLTKFAAGFQAVTPYIMAATIAIQLITAAVQAYQRWQQELRQEAIENSQAYLDLTKSADEWLGSLNELEAKLADSEISGQEYLDTQKQIVGIKDQVVQAYKDKAGAVYDYTKTIRENIKALEEQEYLDWVSESQPEYKEAKQKLEKSWFLEATQLMPSSLYGVLGSEQATIAETLGELQGFNKTSDKSFEWSGQAGNFQQSIKEAQKALLDLRDAGQISQNAWEKYNSSLSQAIKDNWTDTYKQYEEIVQKGAEILAQGDDDYKTYYNNLTAYANDYEQALIKGDKEQAQSAVASYETEKQALQNFLYEADGTLKSGIDANVADYFTNLINDFEAQAVSVRLQLQFQTTPETETNLKAAIEQLFNSNQIKEGARTTDTLKNALSLMSSQAKESSTAYQLLASTAKEYNISVDGLIDALGNAEVIDKSFSDQQTEAKESFASLQTQLESLDDALDSISSAQEEYSENGYITVDTLTSLLSLGDEYLAMLINEEGQLDFNITSEEDLTDSILRSMAARKLDEINAYIKGLQDESGTVDELKRHYDDLAQSAATAAATQALSIDLGTGQVTTNEYGAVALERDTHLQGMVASVQSILATIGSSGRSRKKSGSSSSKSSGSQKDAWLEAYKEELAELDHLKKMDKISTKEYYNELDRLTKKYFSGRNKYHKEERENLEKLWDLYKQILDEEKERYETALKYVDNVIDKRIEELEKEKKALEDKNKAKEDELKLEQLEDNLRKAKQRTMRVYYEGVGWVWESDAQAIAEAQKELDDYNNQKAIDAIDAEIQAWQDYKKSWDNIPSDFEDMQNALIAQQILGKDAEADILNQRMDAFNNFKAGYLKVLQDIEDASKRSAEVQKQLQMAPTTVPTATSGGSGSGGGGSRRRGGLTITPPPPPPPPVTTAKTEFLNYAKSNAYSKYWFKAAEIIRGVYSDVAQSNTKYYTYDPKTGTMAYAGTLLKKFQYNKSYGNPSAKQVANNMIKERPIKNYSGTVKAYTKASGSPFIGRSGIYNVDENGKELAIHNPARGRYTFLQHGDGILNAGLTRNIMAFASNPDLAIYNALGHILASAGTTTNNNQSQIIHIGNISLPNVENANQFIKQLQLISQNH